MTRLVLGTRGSALALWQAGHVRDALLLSQPGVEIDIRVIRTLGDQDMRQDPRAVGFFTREISQALLSGQIDLAVHSLKDLPTESVPGLCLAAVLPREDPADALILRSGVVLPPQKLCGAGVLACARSVVPQTSCGAGARACGRSVVPQAICGAGALACARAVGPDPAAPSAHGPSLDRLPRGGIVLTSSPRRRAQILHRRPDLIVQPVRGNVETRLRKLDESSACALVLAVAGLKRLGLDARITQRLDPDDFVPAPGQGALAVETRAEDEPARRLCAALNDPLSHAAITAERAFLAALGGGCRHPIAAYARPQGNGWKLTGLLAHPDGSPLLRFSHAGDGPPAALGRALGAKLLDSGGRDLLT